MKLKLSRSGMRLCRNAVVFFLAMSVLVGVGYTGVCTAVAQVAFPHQARGSIIEADDGSRYCELLGQPWEDEGHMWGRITNPNVTTFTAEDGSALYWAGPSNLSPASDEFAEVVQERIEALRALDPENKRPIPSDLVTCSGSGLDPDISVAAAKYQVDRLVRTTGKSAEEIGRIIDAATTHASFGFLGEDRVNVLKVNLMLDGKLAY